MKFAALAPVALASLLSLTSFSSVAFAGGEGWLSNLEAAQKLAKEQKKDILIDFTGSDWCGWCIRLKEEVWSTPKWQEEGSKRYVLVELDFPRNTPQSDEVKAYNQKLSTLFGVEGFPTIALLDSEGRPYALTGYQEGGPEAYLKHLEELGQRKAEIAAGVAKAEQAEAPAKALDALFEQLGEWKVAFGYGHLQEQIVALDPKNEAGLGLKHARQLALRAAGQKQSEKLSKCLEAVRAMDAEAADALEGEIKAAALTAELEAKLSPMAAKDDWAGVLKCVEEDYAPKHEAGFTGQVVTFFKGIAKLRLGQQEAALADFKSAKDMAPNSELAERISQILTKLGG